MIYRSLDSVPSDAQWVFAKEVGEVREFHTFATLAEFFFENEANTTRVWHEVLQPFQPIKLYVDVDGKGDDILMGDAAVSEFVLIAAVGDPVVWTADRPGKFSRHLIWEDYWFDSGSSLDVFVRNVVSKMTPALAKLIDFVYPVRAVKFFRLPYSCKLSSQKYPLTPLGLTDVFDSVRMARSMLMAHSGRKGSRGTAVVDAPKSLKAFEAPKVSVVLDDDVVQRVAKTLGVTIRDGYTVQYNVYAINESQFCPFAGRVHASNNSALRIKQIGHWVDVRFMCLDPECKRGTWAPSRDCTAVGYIEERRI